MYPDKNLETTLTDILSNLTDSQASEVLKQVAANDPQVAELINATATNMLEAVDLEEVAEEAFFALDAILVEDCWDRAGNHRDGYIAPEDAANELIEEELAPFSDQIRKYNNLGMSAQERDYLMGVILGLYRYATESKSSFRDWSEDLPLEYAGWLLEEYQKRKRTPDKNTIQTMQAFISKRCPNWKKHLS